MRYGSRMFLTSWFSKANLMGSSYGGWPALGMALYHPDRWKRLFCFSPANALAPFNRMYFLRVAITSFIRNKWLIEHVSIRPLFANEANGLFWNSFSRQQRMLSSDWYFQQNSPMMSFVRSRLLHCF